MILNLKIILKLFIYSIINIFIKSTNNIKPNSLLLIRLDAIGDYVLFRNFIEPLKNNEKYKNYTITLLGNSAWKSLSEKYDHDSIDEFIWLDRDRFIKDIFYRTKKLRELASRGYEVIISPTYSRDFFIVDNLVKLITARKKIGSVGDFSNIKKWQKNLSDNYYDILIPSKSIVMFEFERNKEFFEKLLSTKLNTISLNMKKQHNRLMYDLPKKYAIIFIGASDKYKKWSVEKFSQAANYLNVKYGYDIVICGSRADSNQASKLEKNHDGKLLNLVGKTSLIELTTVIDNCDLMLSNETSAPHIAVALKTLNIFVIYNGSHYGRFTPYPKEISKNYHVIYHPDINRDLDGYKSISNNYGYRTNLYIDDITIKMVKDKIDTVLNNK